MSSCPCSICWNLIMVLNYVLTVMLTSPVLFSCICSTLCLSHLSFGLLSSSTTVFQNLLVRASGCQQRFRAKSERIVCLLGAVQLKERICSKRKKVPVFYIPSQYTNLFCHFYFMILNHCARCPVKPDLGIVDHCCLFK